MASTARRVLGVGILLLLVAAGVAWPLVWWPAGRESVSLDPVLGDRPWLTACLVLLAVAAALAGWLVAGSTREQSPEFALQYEPPAGLGPVQVVFLDTRTAGPAPVAATLLHLAEQGMVRLDRPDEDCWLVTNTATPAQWAAIDPVSRGIADELGATGPTPFRLDRNLAAGKALLTATNDTLPILSQWAQRAGLARPRPGDRGLRRLWFAVALLAAALFLAPGLLAAGGSRAQLPTLVGAIPAAFLLGGFALTSPTLGWRRTDQGRTLWARAGGFHRLLSTGAPHARFDFLTRPETFLAYLPYAVAFGLTRRWARTYQQATGQEPPIPPWYPTRADHTTTGFYTRGDLDALATRITQTIGIYETTVLDEDGKPIRGSEIAGGLSWNGF